MTDALRMLGQQAVAAHQRGDLAAAEALYQQILARHPDDFTARHLLGVLRGQQGRGEEALALIGAALHIRPQAADAWFNQGNVQKNLGRLDDALASYDRALVLRPDYPAAQNSRTMTAAALAETANLEGNALRAQNRAQEALAHYDRALALLPDYPDALNNRGVALWSMGRITEALDSYDAALAAKPDFVEAHYNRGNALRDQIRLDDAMASFDRATALAPDFAPAWRNKGFCALLAGDFTTGLPLYEWRKRLSPPIEARNYRQPLWTGAQDLSGKTLFVYIEQGLGDTIQFYRILALVQAMGARVILSAQDAILALLRHAVHPVELVDSRTTPPAFDYHIPLMSLPLALGMRVESIPAGPPYLRAEPERVARWRGRIGGQGLKIGVTWQGAPGGVTTRAFPLAALSGVAQVPGVRLISLQKGLGSDQLSALPAGMTVEQLDGLDEGSDAFLDSAAVMETLDLVITLDSALAHLAGALGRPAWVALKRVPDWRWLLEREHSPWYPAMRLFRQAEDGDWDDVFTQMVHALTNSP